ncbi:MAG: ABC transporter transmembrane domain-containing protein [Geminicoccaceae bacterium]|nr:ABC transporter transmembrane domain-containing protein [Geminicoccaceae bacterium]
MDHGARRLAELAHGRAPSRDLGRLRLLARYLAPHRVTIAATLLALVLAAAAVLSLGIGLRYLVDGGFAGGKPEALDHAAKAVLLLVLVLALATFARSWLVTRLGERVVADLRRDLFARVVRLSPGFFETTRTGEVLSRLTTDTAVVQTVIGASVTQALRNLLLAVGGVVLLLVTNPKLTGLVLLVVPLVVLPIVVLGRRVRRLSRAAQDRVADLGAAIEENLNAIRTVQAFAQENAVARRIGALADQAFLAASRYAFARALLGAVVIALVFGAIVVVLWIGGQDVLAGRISGGELASFVFYATVVASAVGGLSEIAGDLQRAAGAAERLVELLETRPLVTAPERPARLPARGQGLLRFERVRFAYPARPDRPVLVDFDLEVRPGETVALVGPSGAGKTSVLHLALRFYDPAAGRITFDGIDLRELDPAELRRRIALVPQDPVIFSADARTNIAFGRPEASEAEIRAAAEAAAALDFIEALPQGFSTYLGEKGVRLSGGQKQRIAIARALLCDPELLLLDEATSSLDAESERLVQEALERLRRGRSCLVVAHRLATVRKADRIVVLDEGRVVDQGRHEELVARGGLYARLAMLQFGLERAA